MKRIILVILDGWGWSKEKTGNAILAAKTPNLDYLKKVYPFFLLQASGRAVGLPPSKEGDSEVGHLTLGGGRIIIQHLTKIDEAVKNGTFFENENFIKLVNHVKSNSSKLHLMGLLTSGTVHASLEHLLAMIKYLKLKNGLPKIFIHLFADGKDSGKKESAILIEKLEKELAGSNLKIGSVIGRDFAMDRDNNWKLTQKAYNLLVWGAGERTDDFKKGIMDYYAREITDEVIPPLITDKENALIEEGDGVLFFNFREDSARQLARAFVDQDFNFFETRKFRNLFFATMTNYAKGLKINPIFKRGEIKNTLAEVFQNNNRKQLHIAETIKYAHITYFFNGLREEKFENETDILIPSLSDYAKNPAMRANEIAEKVIEEIKKGSCEFAAVNFANPDMLSHTGDFEATVKGIEIIDGAIGKICQAAQESKTIILITGDHGNAENLTYLGTGEKESRHNPNPVPFYIAGEEFEKIKPDAQILAEEKEIRGMLQDVAPTILELAGLEKPPEMTGISLV